jgi:hypothetical protein
MPLEGSDSEGLCWSCQYDSRSAPRVKSKQNRHANLTLSPFSLHASAQVSASRGIGLAGRRGVAHS